MTVDLDNHCDIFIYLLSSFLFLPLYSHYTQPVTSLNPFILSYYYFILLLLKILFYFTFIFILTFYHIQAPHVSYLTRCVVVSFGQTKEKVHVIRDLELDPWVVM